MIFIKGGYVYHPEEEREGWENIIVSRGKIAAIGPCLTERDAERLLFPGEDIEVISSRGCIVSPGLADAHVHFRDPGFTYKEDIISGAGAAVKGGYTELVLMANTRPVVDNPDTLRYVLEKGKKTGIHIQSCAALTRGMRGKQLVDMEGLLREGATCFSDDGFPILGEGLVREAMERAAALGAVLAFHEEDPAYIANPGIHRGAASARLGVDGSDRKAEIVMIRRDVRLACETGAKIVIQHISTREGVELVRQARRDGHTNIHAEATPHHFTLTQEALIRHAAMAKVNPPLREEADRQAILDGLSDGTIELIATDHAPHSDAEKARDIANAPSGVIGLETALSLGIRELVQPGRLSMGRLLRAMSSNVRDLYGLPSGRLAKGEAADLILVDPNQSWIADHFESKSQNSPFLGDMLPGKVKLVLCDGKILYRD